MNDQTLDVMKASMVILKKAQTIMADQLAYEQSLKGQADVLLSVDTLGLTVRTKNALARFIRVPWYESTIWDVLKVVRRPLWAVPIRHFGEVSVDEVITALTERGYVDEEEAVCLRERAWNE